MTTAPDYQARRRRLASLLPPGECVELASGSPPARNYPANPYPFRANSNFLYFCGWNEPDCVARLQDGECTLFYRVRTLEDCVWEGDAPPEEELKRRYGFDQLRPIGDFQPSGLDLQSEELRRALVQLRLVHDEAGIRQLEDACTLTVACHEAGRRAARPGVSEVEVLADMLHVLHKAGAVPSFSPIVSVHGEVLHQHHQGNVLGENDLLLIDFGAENREGWAGDVTRTWPVNGQGSARQKEIYEVVLRAQVEAVRGCRPGVEFRDLHLQAARTICQGLIDLGLMKGDAAELVARGAHALFFPHGLGHLLGLDVHDMEEFGDLAGYAAGRQRSQQFGLNFLRLDRPLIQGMAVTIEPGFYWIPGLLEDPERTGPFADALHLPTIAAYREVRGIRIEDDVLVGDGEPIVLTETLDKLDRCLTSS